MSHLVLDPQHLVTIDYDTFAFAPITLETRTSGEDLLMLVWDEDRRFLLHDREVPREEKAYIAEVRVQVAVFNQDPITGWRELATAAHTKEIRTIDEERQALYDRSRALARAYENAGFGALRARSEARAALAG